jgi:hypothetical protein
MRRLAVAVLVLALAGPAHAQALVLPDGSRYASVEDYYAGTWKWERPQPRQTAIARFGRDGSFFFHNLTSGLQHYGRYFPGSTTFMVSLEKTCSENGARCQTHEPPATRDYPFEPLGADLFMAGIERWERQKSNQRPPM